MADVDEYFTDVQKLIDEREEMCQKLLYQQQRAFEWFAAQDIVYWDLDIQETVKRPSAKKIADELGVTRQTFYNWRKTVPNAEEKIKEAKQDLLQINIGAVWNGVFLKACDGDVNAAVLYLSNFDPSFKLPSRASKQSFEPSGLGDLLNNVRRKMASTKVAPAT